MMKYLAILGFLAVSAGAGFAQVHVNGYYKANGTYVDPYWRSSPNGTKLDNYNEIGNPYRK